MAVMKEACRHGIAAASRKFGISRTTCHAWRKRWDPDNPRSLADPPRAKGGHPAATPAETAAAILAASGENPAWGCKRLAAYVTLLGMPVSSPTVQKILIDAGLGRAEQRRKRNLMR